MNAFFSDGAARLDAAECLALLNTATVGRMAFIADGKQQLLPINYAVLNGVIYFRTAEGTSFSKLTDQTDVVFEVDYHDDLFRWGWSVKVDGQIRHATDQSLLETLAQVQRPKAWATGERNIVLSLVAQDITGRRVRLRDQ